MTKSNFPRGIDEKLPLDEPDLWDVETFNESERSPVSRGNGALINVFNETRTALPKLIASVRWSQLRTPYVEFAKAAGMSPNGYVPLEKDQTGGGAHREKITKLLKFWEKNDISAGIREQLLDLLLNPDLLELDESCVDLLSAVEFTREQSMFLLDAKHLTAFYQRVGYELGHAQVDKKFPSIYNTLWQRERTGTVPEFGELLNFVETMYAGKSEKAVARRALRHAQAEAVWDEVRKNQYLDRSLEEPLAAFLCAMEKHLAREHGTTLTAKSLGDHFGLGPLHCQQLIQSELVETNVIAPAAKKILKRGEVQEFLESWELFHGMEQAWRTFGKQCEEAMVERGLTAADIGKLLDVKAPEERGKKPIDRNQRYRPDAEVRSVIYHNHVSRQIPVEAMIQVIARDSEHAEELRASYFGERERFFRRSGYKKEGDGLHMRIMRELANVQMKDLAKRFLPPKKRDDKTAVREKDLELQRLERQEGKQYVITFAEVFPILQAMATEASEAALARLAEMGAMNESLKEFSSVRQMAQNLIKGMKGANMIAEAMSNIAQNDSESLRSDLISRMSEGTFVCALSSLQLMSKATIDRPLPEEVKRDWYERFPKQLEEGLLFFDQARTPVAKAICTLIATKNANPMDFFKRVPGGVSTQGTKVLRDLDADKNVEWKHLHRYLLPFNLEPSDITYRFVKMLHETGDLTATLKEIVPLLVKAGKEVHSVNLPGVTPDDLKAYLKKKK